MEKKKVTGYLDIHSHILPKLDDGSRSMEMTMEMLKIAYEQGTRVIVATPHHYCGHKNPSANKVKETYQAVCEVAKEEFPELQILLGNEIYYADCAIEELLKGEIFTLADTSYVLVEFSTRADYKRIYGAVSELTRNGYYPIIAHVERYSCLLGNEDKISELIRLGAYMQTNCDTILEGFFSKEQRFIMKLMQNEEIHFLGSDCHNDSVRIPRIGDALIKLEKRLSAENYERITKTNMESFLAGSFLKNT